MLNLFSFGLKMAIGLVAFWIIALALGVIAFAVIAWSLRNIFLDK